MTAIHKTNKHADGTTGNAGFYAVDPKGNLVLLRPGTRLKAGWQLATADDIAKAEAAEAKRQSRKA